MSAPITKESASAVIELLKGNDHEGKVREECTVGGLSIHKRLDPDICEKDSMAVARFMDHLKGKERARVLHEVWYTLKGRLGAGTHQTVLNEVIDALRLGTHTQEGWNC